MIDTLMVLWTSGTWKSFLRSLGMFLLLFTGVCVLLLLVVTSGSRWSGLAATVAQSHASAPSNAEAATPNARSVPAPTAVPTTTPYIIPVILQNPVLPDSTSASHASRNDQKHVSHHHTSTYTPPAPPVEPAMPVRRPVVPTATTGLPDLSNPLPSFP